MYELTSTEKATWYLHVAAGFLMRATWLKAIRVGNYATWPMIIVKNINKFFPKSDEMQKGHMRQTKQGVLLTNVQQLVEDILAETALQKEQDIMVKKGVDSN